MPFRVRGLRVMLFPALLGTTLSVASAQTGFTEAERTDWETFLSTAKIGEAVQLGGPEAVTRPWKLTLTKGEVTRFGLWKDIDLGAAQGGPDCWRYEIAAYELDVLLGVGMVLPVVERTFQGRWGSLQLWMDGVEGLKDRMARGPDALKVEAEEWDRKAYLQRAFDSLIANEDRNVNNILIGDDDRKMILIDHSRTFRTAKPYATALVYGASGLMKTKDGTPYPFLQLPRAFVEKIRSLDAKSVKAAVKGHLTGKEIQTLLARRDLILKEVDDLIRQKGEAEVLY